ncbi:MAG: PH domain-containing protein [Actinobacteria bacterium]|nr:PH domain-containing protein [Actinomycetota bacterium]
MASQYHLKVVEGNEVVIFDKRHSLWEIWRNFLIGIAAVVGLVLLLTKFSPGPSDPMSPSTNWGYIALVSAFALFFVSFYGAWPAFKQRNLTDKNLFLPLVAVLLAAAGWGALMWFRNSKGFADIWSIVVWVSFAVVISGWLIYPMLSWYFSHFILTDRRIILVTGILTKKTKAIPLDQLNDISGSQNAWERMFNYGDLVIESAGEFGQQPFTNISDPVGVKKMIFEQRRLFEERQERRQGEEVAKQISEAVRSAQPQAAPSGEVAPRGHGAVDELEVVDGLKKLDELRQSGALTEEEFQEAKRELLERMRESRG